MNLTNTSDAPLWDDYFSESLRLDEIDFCIVLIVSLVQLLVLGLLIKSERTVVRQKPSPKALTSVNVLILLMIVSNCFVSGFKFYTWKSINDTFLLIVYSTVMNFSLSVHLFVLVCYTWIRGIPVIQQCFPWAYPMLKGCLILFGLIQFVAFLASVATNVSLVVSSLSAYWEALAQINLYLSFTIDAYIFVFDIVVILFYLRYLASISKEPAIHDIQRLKIISRYGIVSCLWLELWLSSYVAFNSFSSQTIPSVGISAYLAASGFFNLGILIYVSIQLAMKWFLVKEKKLRLSIVLEMQKQHRR
ncbi:hypothetical protein BCR33DRAFT_723113 [Rhizoclosmatium globosum]|uniref:Uncharacterized protein n=1 Tax=Rhizoclosmatium globosum TaxID=329046 RepID=A0A1Y2BGQ0_9FUNG|nr:hypothetical protein BCR33DRAFT_723113 [Rhizoclosmatium globosum]|eukprot:ORY33906.1 hypothetical protein BCR33DRAFT_723113 [Rhizoclosmatium globosum]